MYSYRLCACLLGSRGSVAVIPPLSVFHSIAFAALVTNN